MPQLIRLLASNPLLLLFSVVGLGYLVGSARVFGFSAPLAGRAAGKSCDPHRRPRSWNVRAGWATGGPPKKRPGPWNGWLIGSKG